MGVDVVSAFHGGALGLRLVVFSLVVPRLFYMDASLWQGRFDISGSQVAAFISGLFVQNLSPAGPDGIRGSAHHLWLELYARIKIQIWRIAV